MVTKKTESCACEACKCDPCECGKSGAYCSSGKGCSLGWGSLLRIVIAVGLIVGAYAWGVMCGHDRDDQYERDSRHFSREYSQGDMRSGMMGRMNTYDDDRKDMPQAMTKHTIPMMSGALMMQGSGMESIQGMMSDMSMADMGRMLEGLTGETLNQRFLEAMIPHHQAAVDMAKYIAASNKSELVKLGADIITAQTKEIEQMKAWQKAWGYTK